MTSPYMYDSYLGRLDTELEKLLSIQEDKSSVADHYRQQYASREDAIRTAMVRERQLFESSGIGELVALIGGYITDLCSKVLQYDVIFPCIVQQQLIHVHNLHIPTGM